METTISPTTTAQTIQNGVQPFAVPQVKPDLTPYDTIASGAVNSVLGDYTNLQAQQEKQAKAQESSAGKQIDYMSLLSGKTADTQAANETAGVNTEQAKQLEYAQQLATLNAQAQSLNREAQAAPILTTEENAQAGRVTTTGVAQGQTEARLRQNALKALSLGQQSDIAAAAMTGSSLRLAAAKLKAQEMIDLKYKPIEEALARERELYKLNEGSLKRIDAKRAEALQIAIKKDEQRVAEEKANKKAAQDLIVQASPYAPPSVISQAQKLFDEGKSPVEVAISLGKYGGDYLGDLVKRSTLDKNDLEMEKTRKEIKAMETPLPTTAPQGSNAHFVSTLLNSAVNKESLSQTERTAVTKNLTVLDQLDSLEQNIKKQNKTGFVKGKVNNLMAAIGQNADVGTINAQLQAIVPNLARGVYGEVGVLTDNDIANYRKTLPNLTSPNDQNDAVLALTLGVVQKNLKNTLETAANSKMDVSRFVPQYQQVTQKINEINDRIGYTDIQVKEYADINPQVKPMVEKLISEGRKGSEILQILGVEY